MIFALDYNLKSAKYGSSVKAVPHTLRFIAISPTRKGTLQDVDLAIHFVFELIAAETPIFPIPSVVASSGCMSVNSNEFSPAFALLWKWLEKID